MLKKVLHQVAIATFPLWERLGLHVVPAHYYFPVPPSEDLPDALFDARSESVGVDWQRDVQRRYLRDVFPAYLAGFDATPNGGLSLVDGAVLHAMIRHHKPRKIVEVGSGDTTRITAAACVQNAKEGHACEFVAIEPYPRAMLRANLPGLTRLRAEKVQQVPFEEFVDCDLLFIDSSHVVRMGGDVTFLQLEVLPRLKPGCLVHFHDILLPGHYWKDWVVGRRYYWTEQYLLHAFLLFNREFTVLWAARLMQLEAEAELAGAFPFYRGNDRSQRVSSLWIQRREPLTVAVGRTTP
jgi:predicted O-methyltransferase YrrM